MQRNPKDVVNQIIAKIPDEFKQKFNIVNEFMGLFEAPQLLVPEYSWKLWDLIITVVNGYIKMDVMHDGSPDIMNTPIWKIEIWEILTDKNSESWKL